MGKVDMYREALKGLSDWGGYLLAESGLPGPRGNLEPPAAVAEEASPPLIWRYAALLPEAAPGSTAREFLAFCGVLGLGRFLVAGEKKAARLLRARASGGGGKRGPGLSRLWPRPTCPASRSLPTTGPPGHSSSSGRRLPPSVSLGCCARRAMRRPRSRSLIGSPPLSSERRREGRRVSACSERRWGMGGAWRSRRCPWRASAA